ncbi:MAG: glycosyltransferase, partial [Lachnospiraceae bacterium]|nr:glycosyltransferase [Lachnospiraceae bacterium]
RNRVNTIYLFDRGLYERMHAQGIETVRYLPLAVNARRMAAMRRACDADGGTRYAHDITFVGGLYADKNNFYNDIVGDLPVFLKSSLEDVLALQTNVYGRDLIGDPSIVTGEMVAEIRKFIRFEVPEVYAIDYDELVRDMLRTQATEMDRFSLLEALGREHPGQVDLFTRWDSPSLPGVRNLGYASYLERMPQVFYQSKVNLNITLRTIRTGMPLRALDVLAAGGFLLSTWQEELAEYFEQGRELVLARDPEEMLFLADWFLAHDADREAIARRGCERVSELFDYEKVLPGVLGEI